MQALARAHDGARYSLPGIFVRARGIDKALEDAMTVEAAKKSPFGVRTKTALNLTHGVTGSTPMGSGRGIQGYSDARP